MKNSDIDFNRTFKLLEKEVKHKFTNFKYVIDDSIKDYVYTNSDDNTEFTQFGDLKIFYPDKHCYFGDLRKSKKDQTFTCGIKEALVHVTHVITNLIFEKSFIFFINLNPMAVDYYYRIEVTYSGETKTIYVMLVKSLSFGFIGPRKGIVVKKEF